MTPLLKLSQLIDWLNERVGKGTFWLVLVVALISAGNASYRFVFNDSSNGLLEVQWYLFAAIFLLCSPYTLQMNEHVRIDVLSGKLSPRGLAVIDIIGTVFFLLPMVITVLWLSLPLVAESYKIQEMSSNAGGLIHLDDGAIYMGAGNDGILNLGTIAVAGDENLIDLSLRRVSEQQSKRKQTEHKREKRADKLFEKLCKEKKIDLKETYQKIAVPLIDEYGELLTALENIAVYGKETFEGVNIDKKWQEDLLTFAQDNIKVSEVVRHGDLTISSTSGEGVDLLKSALKEAQKITGKDIEYISAPKYRISASGIDYSEADKLLQKAADAAITYIKKHGGEGSFEKVKV